MRAQLPTKPQVRIPWMWCSAAFLTGVAVALVALWELEAPCRWSKRILDNYAGLRRVGGILTSPGAQKVASFTDLFELVRSTYPSAVASPEADNPFPGILPEKCYRRLRVWPKDLPWDRIPVMWNATPLSPDSVTVLLADGLVQPMSLAELQVLVAACGGD